jgi:hypothetical protein
MSSDNQYTALGPAAVGFQANGANIDKALRFPGTQLESGALAAAPAGYVPDRSARTPGSLPERREFDGLDQALRISPNAPIGTRAIVGLPASAVLHVEHNRVENLPRQSFSDGGLIHGDPSAQNLPASS